MILYAIKYWDIDTESWRYHYCKTIKDVSKWLAYLIENSSDYQIFSLSWSLESEWSFDKEEIICE